MLLFLIYLNFLGMSKQEQIDRIKSEQERFKKENTYNQEYNARANKMSSIISDFEKLSRRQATLKRSS